MAQLSNQPNGADADSLTLRERTRLAGILARLASPFENERAAAGLLATAFLQKHQLAWTDVVGMVPPPPMQAVPDPGTRDRRRGGGRLWRGYCRRQHATPGQALNFTG